MPGPGKKGRSVPETGDHRIIYTVEDDVLAVMVVHLGHRRDVYEH